MCVLDTKSHKTAMTPPSRSRGPHSPSAKVIHRSRNLIYIYISTHSRFYTFNLTMTCIPIKCRSLCVQPAASFSGRLVLIQTYGLRESPNALGTVTERRPCLKLLHSDRAVIQENAAPHHVTVVAPSPFGLPELVGLSPAAVLGNFLRLPQLGGSVEHTMIPYNSQ
jgi:hypothetical protein